MVIERLSLQNFLSYEKQQISFNKGLNVVTGPNASGKTNLIEAIYMSSIGKTARNTKDKDLINWQSKEGARVELAVTKNYGGHSIAITIDSGGKKYIMIDGLPISRLGELLGGLNVVFFSPDEMKLIKDSPVDRRRFLDISLSQQSKTYFYALLKYNKLLAQRNKLLKDYRNNASLDGMVALVDDAIAPCAEHILLRRKEFVDKLRPHAAEQHQRITGGKEKLDISYETEDIDFSDIKNGIKALLKSSLEKDKRLEYTTAGVHRDDLKIVAGGIDVRKFGSQGQQRTAVLSLKLAEIFMLKESTGEYPVLLLDDVLSELDEKRQRALLSAVKGVQTILTGTDFDGALIDYDYAEFRIRDAKITKTEKTHAD
ncbi:MAG: DNA replication/repair protein RecF [Clostridia bacterium]|nr:DNA replication/repair protein RecF [Clostridia bacterium]